MKSIVAANQVLRTAVGALLLVAVSLLPAAAQVAGRPITIIVPYSPGTGIDILARALGAELTRHWGQSVVVDNKPGASGNIGTQVAARAAPDGQTLLMIAKTFVTNGSLFKNVPYDPVKSFVPVIKLATGSIVLAVHPSVPADSVAAFIQYVKARPGEVNYGSPGFATPHHLAMELFKHATQTNLVHIPYKGTSGVMSDLVGNHVSAMFVPPTSRCHWPRTSRSASSASPAPNGSQPRPMCRRLPSRAWPASRSTSGSGCWLPPERRPRWSRATTRSSTSSCARRR